MKFGCDSREEVRKIVDGRRTDARAWVYYKLTSCEPDGSGELIINRDLEKKASLM